MVDCAFPDGNISDLIARRSFNPTEDTKRTLQFHSSLIRRLSLEKELEGHQGCVNALSWNSGGSLLISGSDDARVNIWGYTNKKLLQSIETGHSANIFCTKFIPETSDEIVVSGAGDAEVRLFRVSQISGSGITQNASEPSALFRCHSRRVKKLAVENGNPNIVWSASEDGTVRQHDVRESVSCPPVGSTHQECRSVLLDLRSGAKKSLADNPRHCLALKSCDISPTRPHQILVGGSDAFGRLYDRRMLPPLSSSEKRLKPPPCVNYFCPSHLSDHGRPSLHLTHVTFSPNGEEILLSYSGEHVYLMDVSPEGDSCMTYKATDPKFWPPNLSLPELSRIPSLESNASGSSRASSARVRKCHELLKFAQKSLMEETNYFYAIEACTEVLEGKGPDVGQILKRDSLCARAALFLKRKWKNDAHMAVRDCKKALTIDPCSVWAHYYMAAVLMQLGKLTLAQEYAKVAQCLDTENPEVCSLLETIRERQSSAESEKKDTNGRPKLEERRLGSLSELLYRTEMESSDASIEREDSDYEDEMELDFETSISGDEDRDIESGILRGSLNLRFHRRAESSKGGSAPAGSPSSSAQSGSTSHQLEAAVDMKQRYVGHCNVGTDIKQATFLGCKGDYVASGSDDGRWFIWEKKTGRLIKMLAGDENVVNCVQCHPFDCTVATSGIDNTIKLWTPRALMPSIVAGGTAGPETADVLNVMASNQLKMSRSRDPISPFEILERFRMHDFGEGVIQPFECAQS